jgi:hypothetical protein
MRIDTTSFFQRIDFFMQIFVTAERKKEDDIMIQKVLRYGRITKYLPYLRGIGLLQRFYQFTLPKRDLHLSVDDFDGNLKMGVDIRECIGISIWHRPKFYEKNERKLFCDAITPGW